MIEFHVNNTSPASYTCSPDLLPENSKTESSLFSWCIALLSIEYGNTYGSGAQTDCPYLFKNAYMSNGIELSYQVDSFLYVTLFKFQKVNDTKTINSKMPSLAVHGYNFKLDTSLLHPLVFENLNSLSCLGNMNSIQADLFKNFRIAISIYFDMDSLGTFYHQIGLE
jgi:hypothetical protein